MQYLRSEVREANFYSVYYNGPELCISDLMQTSCYFVKQISGKTQIARKEIGVIRYLSPYVSVGTLDQLHKLFIRPHFDYADIINHISQINNSFGSSINLNNLIKSIEHIQYQAARAVTEPILQNLG